MMPGTFPLAIYRGDTSAWTFVLWGDEAKTEPVDLSLYAVKAEIRDRPGGSTVVPLALIVTLPNEIDASLSPAASRVLPASGRWDLQLTDQTGRIMTILAGPVKVTGDITDSTGSPLASSTSRDQPVGFERGVQP
jgi:hypothetical protein